jgi:SAM-dependent methyltransferase
LRRLLTRLAAPPQIMAKRDTIEGAAKRHGVPLNRVLNVGSKNVRIGTECVNLDIVPGPSVDVVGDAHRLAEHVGEARFDTVVMSAVLQYCENPSIVIEQARRVLEPGGWLLVDAPFIQPYCPDGRDLWRFTADGLRRLCEPHFTIVEVVTSIPTGPAVASMAQAAAQTGANRYARAAVAWGVTLALWPLRFMPHADPRTAGAFLLVGRKT